LLADLTGLPEKQAKGWSSSASLTSWGSLLIFEWNSARSLYNGFRTHCNPGWGKWQYVQIVLVTESFSNFEMVVESMSFSVVIVGDTLEIWDVKNLCAAN